VAHFRQLTSIQENGLELSMTAVPSVTSGPIQVHYGLSAAQENMQLQLFSLTGQMIADLTQEAFVSGTQGQHVVQLDLTKYNLADGMYMIRLGAGEHFLTERIMIAK